MPDTNADESKFLARLATEAGLERLLESDPDLLARARALSKGYQERLGRPRSTTEEPAHVYLPKPRA